MNKIILYVIRHGKTICNENRLYCGKSDVSLSELGIEEIKNSIGEKNYPKCKLNYTSGAKRANETFELIFQDKKYEERKGFFEYDFGDFEMKSYEMLKEDERYISWITDKAGTVRCPNGESKKEFYIRLTKALNGLIDEIIANNEIEGILVCHGGTIGTLLELFCDGNRDFYSYQPSCGSGYKLEIIRDKDIRIEVLEEL